MAAQTWPDPLRHVSFAVDLRGRPAMGGLMRYGGAMSTVRNEKLDASRERIQALGGYL
jgi:hypothetical protein